MSVIFYSIFLEEFLEDEDYESDTEDEDSGISDSEPVEPEEVAQYNTHLVDYLHTIPGFADFLREFFEDHFEEFQAIYENVNFTHDQKVHYFGVWMEHICRQRREFRRRHRERFWQRVTQEANQQAE